MKTLVLLFLTAVLIIPARPALASQELTPLSITLDEYAYPYPVQYLPLSVEGQDLRMAYMDVKPAGKWNGRTVVLLHGKNFFGAYWKDTIAFLTSHGYRVIVPDQIGFGKSTKPNIHYSFHLLASNTKKIGRAHV
jgi:pimeloyl-ACP methyl ester carboxylesterase